MDNIQFLLLGLGNGAVFAALGLALVVTFRSSGVINFAAGVMALYAAYTYVFLRDGRLLSPFPGTPTFIELGSPMALVPAMAISVAISAVLGLVVYLLVFRPLRHRPPVASAVASLGLMIVFQAVLAQRVGTRPITVGSIFPQGRFDLGDAVIQTDRIWFAVTIVGLGLALAAVDRFTSFGLMTRAAANTEKGATVTGLAPDRIDAANWAIAGAVTGLAGVLISPMVPLVPISYTLFIIPALAAALVGQFRALGPTVLAGLALGMLQSEATFLQVRLDWMPNWIIPKSGLPELLPLVLILAVLLIRARPLTSRGVDLHQAVGAVARPRSPWAMSLVALAVGVVAIFTLSSEWRLALVTSLILGVISLSLVVVTGYGGQISLAQLTLAGVAGFLLSTLANGWGVPFPISPVLAALGATVVGVAFGLPAVRLRGLSLGIVTLALAAALEAVWFRNNDFNGGIEGAIVPDPTLFGVDLGIGAGLEFPRRGFLVLCLVTLVGLSALVVTLRRSRFGAAMMAVRVNERAAAAAGVDVVRVKLTVFAIGAFIAGLGGSLLVYKQGRASFDLFTVLVGLGVFALVYLAGITSVSGAVVAGVLGAGGIVFTALVKGVDLGDWYTSITGLLLVVSLIAFPEGLVGTASRLLPARKPEVGPPPLSEALAEESETPRREVSLDGPIALAATELTVSYGKVLAVDNVSFEIPEGIIAGLIGPNGAGKTTMLDALTGFVPCRGSVRSAEGPLDGLAPHRRARMGVARTFQSAQLCDDLSVMENMAIGLAAGGSPSRLGETIELVGLSHRAHTRVGDLSQGQRQMVALGRALAGSPRVLLLDEPAGGLDSNESRQLGTRLRQIRDSGVTLVLVDHDMGLVLGVCDQILVLDFGALIASGRPAEVRANPEVTRAYLGRPGATL